jgi:hypothetical protein
VVAVALAVAIGLQRLGGSLLVRRIVIGAVLIACAGASLWADSIRDTRRVVVTRFVEARWVGGLDPMHLPLVAVWTTTVLVVLVAIALRLRARDRTMARSGEAAELTLPTITLATAFVIAILVGLLPGSIDRVRGNWHPQAYDRGARHNLSFDRVEVYPARVRSRVLTFKPGSIVFADLNNNRRVASLVPVFIVGESIIRKLEAEPVSSVDQATDLLNEPLEGFSPSDYLVLDRSNTLFEPFVQAARSCGWTDRSTSATIIFERGDARC